MTTLVVETPGIASVQDAGRFGLQRFGIAPAGAMDRLALAAANALVCNPTDAAAIEIGPLGITFRIAEGDACLAVCGAARTIEVDGEAVPLDGTFAAAEGQTLRLGPARRGVFSYLATAGGLSAAAHFNSCSVLESARLGSPHPRRLHRGDAIEIGHAQRREATVGRRLAPRAPGSGPIRVVTGPQIDFFPDGAFEQFLAAPWTIAAASDRMAYRLDGSLGALQTHNIISDANVYGSIQIAGNGQPLVMMADRGTIGGYPRIATIITADLGRFAQMGIGQPVTFVEVSVGAAQAAARAFAASIAGVPQRIEVAGRGHFSFDALLGANLAGAAVNALDEPALAALGRGAWGEPSLGV